MAKKYLDDNGLLYLWGKIKEKFALKTHTHTKSEITDFPTTMPPTSHTHGNITNTGTLQTTDVTIANGDKLVITDSSNSSKVARASLSFDASTESKVLSKKGTWVDLPSGVSPSDSDPLMDGTASAGSSGLLARGDHVHPTDTSRASSTHSHGYLSNNGTFGNQSSAITISNGDYLVIGDASVSGKKLAYSNLTFDTTTDTKALTKKGTWETFSKDGEANVLEGVQINGTDLTIDANKKVNVPVFTGATIDTNGTVGLVPAPRTTDVDRFSVLVGAGGWRGLAITDSSGNSIMSDLAVDGSRLSLYLKSATTTLAGLMSSSDKSKLNSISMTNGVIDSSCLPSFVDDVIEAYARANQTELGSTWLATGSATGTVITPEAGKIYVLMNSSTNYEANTQFRWGGTAYVQLNDSGCTSITNAEIDTIVAQ